MDDESRSSVPAEGQEWPTSLLSKRQGTDHPKKRGLHITIGVAPRDYLYLTDDLSLIKSALLYADEAKLYSIQSYAALSMSAVAEFSFEQRLEFLETIPYDDRDEGRKVKEIIARYRELASRRRHTLLELARLSQFKKSIEEASLPLADAVRQQAARHRTTELESALASGYLSIHQFDKRMQVREVIQELFEGIASSLSDPATFPLFDDTAAKVVKQGLQDGLVVVSEPGLEKSKHCSLAANLLERLPLFEGATVDEILDVRKELERPLVRFRSGMIQYAEKIQSAIWDQDFESEAQLVFFRDIAPAVEEIEQAVRDNSFLRALTQAGAVKPVELVGKSAFALLLAQAGFLPHAVACNIGLGVAAASALNDLYLQWKKKRQEVEANQLFFYYKARKVIGKVTKRPK